MWETTVGLVASVGSTSPKSCGRAAELASALEADGAADECFGSEARRVAPPMKPVLSLSSASVLAVDSCLERRFNLLNIDLKPLDDDGDVGDVGSFEDGTVAVESRADADAAVSFAGPVASDTPVGTVGSSYRSALPSTAPDTVGLSVVDVATTVVPKAGPVLDFRCSPFARRSSSALLAFSACLACFAAAFSSALRAFAALLSSSEYC